MNEELIAPCGMNCAVCAQYLALKHEVKSKGVRIPYCPGCRPRNRVCAFLKKRCAVLLNGQVRYCFECRYYPCERLLKLDKRYKTFFHASTYDNLEYIKAHGVERFLEREGEKWRCPECGDTICCHNGVCFGCGLDELKTGRELYRWEDA